LVHAQDNWPQWRGPDGNGVSASTGLPVSWTTEDNVVWKTELPSWSGGTPIIWGDRILVTSPSAVDSGEVEAQQQQQQTRRRGRRGGRGGYGRRPNSRHPGGQSLLLLCLSKETGEILWRKQLDEGNEMHNKGNNTSPSPVTDGEHIWAVTGNGLITAMDMDGNDVWKFNLQETYGQFGHNWGYACSPLLHDGVLFIQVLHGMKTDDPSYVVAIDAATGVELWHRERPTDALSESPDSYTTPVLLELDGRTQIVITGGDYVTGHDPETGDEVWRQPGLNPGRNRNFRIIASPVAVDGMVYAPTRVRPLLALKVDGDGALADEPVWTWNTQGSPDVPTPVCDGEAFYMVNDSGLVTRLDAKTGAVVWGPERTVRGTVSSSPLLADGKIYFTNEDSVTVVVSAGLEFELLAANELDGSYTLSSPVPSGNKLFIRTATHLYCIGTDQN
jgi:outer membrane protein assembly factor BamB